MSYKFRFRNNAPDGGYQEVESSNMASAIKSLATYQSGQYVVRDIDFSGKDLSGLDLSQLTFEGCNFDDADFTKSDLTNSTISGPLNRTGFRKAFLHGTRFKTTARDIDLSGAMLDMASWQGSTVEGIDVTDAKWRVEDLEPWDRERFDADVVVPGARKYETIGAVATERDPFKGVWMTGIKGLDASTLPPWHETIRKAANRISVAGFVADMVNNKIAYGAALGWVGYLSSTLASRAGPEFPDLMEKAQSISDKAGKFGDHLLNSVTPWTPESAGVLERLVDAGLSHNAAMGLYGVGTVAVLAGAAAWKRMEASEKIAKYVKAKARAIMDSKGITGEVATYIAHRARLLCSKDRKQLSQFRDMVDACSGETHRMLSDEGGYFVVCDALDFARALDMVYDRLSGIGASDARRPTTFWFSSSKEGDFRIPTTLSFVPAEDGIRVVAMWTAPGGDKFQQANLYDGTGNLVETVKAEDEPDRAVWYSGSDSTAKDLLHATTSLLMQNQAVALHARDRAPGDSREGMPIPPEIRDRFHFHGGSHELGRAHDGTWMLRRRDTGDLDCGSGNTAVYGVRDDGTVIDMLYVDGNLWEDRSIPAPPDPSNAAETRSAHP